jgi:hypothetical protein
MGDVAPLGLEIKLAHIAINIPPLRGRSIGYNPKIR